MNNFQLVNFDTDSITICKPCGEPFSEEEQDKLINALNAEFPKQIKWEPDVYFPKLVVLRAKNYIMQDEKGKVKIKGSALKSSKAEIACKEFQKAIIQTILDEKFDYVNIYNKYIKEACNVTQENIKRWVSKRTFTKKLDTSERANETKQKDALAGSNYKEGDKFYLIFREDGTLVLAENFDGSYDKLKMCEKIYKSAQVFSSVIPVDELFINYKLKKNQKALEALINE